MVVPAQPQRPPLPRSAAFQRLRFDKLEWGGPNTGASARWDMVAVVGTDYDKLFFKSEGFYNGKTRTTEEGQFQVLYSRLISYYFDAPFGVRQDFSKKSHRTYAVIGLEGLAPGFIEIDADAYISQKGELSASITAFHYLLITNRLILQPRIDVSCRRNRYLIWRSAPELRISSWTHACATSLRATWRHMWASIGTARSARRRRLPEITARQYPACRPSPAYLCSGRPGLAACKIDVDTL